MTRRPMRTGLVVLVAAGAAGCTLGGLDTASTIQNGPAGIRLEVGLAGEAVLRGELLAIDAKGMLVRADPEVSSVAVDGVLVYLPAYLVPERIRAGTDRPAGTEGGRMVRFSRQVDREWLRGLSRFPYGLSPETERRLLAAYDEARVDTLEREPVGESELEFLARVADETERFRDRNIAIRHGYRRVGPDFPGMGEHWVNPGLVLSGGIDPSRPQILTYVVIDGRPRLTGAAFAMPLGPDEAPPETPVHPDLWHDHDGSIDEETLVLESPHTMAHDPDGPRLAMFHVWTWPENPDGAFAQNNWALPWVRLGMEAPATPDPAVARALSLAGEGERYYRTLLSRVVGVHPGSVDVDPRGAMLAEVVSDAARRVERSLDGGAGPEAERLRTIWTDLWSDLDERADPATRAALAPARARWGGGE